MTLQNSFRLCHPSLAAIPVLKVSYLTDIPLAHIEVVKSELMGLMRKTQAMKTPESEFPNLAKLLGSESDDGASIRARLRSTLLELEEDEQEAATVQKQEGVIPDRPVAKVAMILLGLAPRSGKKSIGDRRKLAAPIRGVALRTMRKDEHQPQIALELATYLCEEMATRPDTPRLAPIPAIYPSLAALGSEDCAATLAALDEGQARDLFRELVRSYDAFVAALTLSLQWFTAPAGTAKTLFTALRLLGERGFQDERFDLPRGGVDQTPEWPRVSVELNVRRRRTLRHAIMMLTLLGEKSGESRYALAVWVLGEIDRLLPGWSRTEQQHLERLAKEADGHDFIFVETMERSDIGRGILSSWAAMSACPCDVGAEGASRQDALRRGFRLVGELLEPGSGRRLDRKELNRYLDTAGGTDPLIPYVERVEQEIHYSFSAFEMTMQRGGVRAMAQEYFDEAVRGRGESDSVVW